MQQESRTSSPIIVLVNLGTPASPHPSDVRAYLAEFLSDRRVVPLPRLLWYPILYGVILPFRSRKSAVSYQQIWGEDGSPLLVNTRLQVEALRKLDIMSGAAVEPAMRYGKPSLKALLQQVAPKTKVVIVPLFPQYSTATTASVMDVVDQVAKKRGLDTAFAAPFYNHPLYIQAIAAFIRRSWSERGRARKLILSFHGLPEKFVLSGDPYQEQCEETARLIAEELGLTGEEFILTYQSRFGRAKWLEPYTDKVLVKLAKEGVEQVDVVCPGFMSDCLETLEEIEVRYNNEFLKNGGKVFNYIPALNGSSEATNLLAAVAIEAFRRKESN